jgi:hypothetical protein
MIWILDLLFLFVVSAHLTLEGPSLGILVCLLNLAFFFQFGKTALLLGEKRRIVPTPKKVKAAVLAILLASPFFYLIGVEPANEAGPSFLMAVNEDLFPLFVGVCLLSALLLLALVAEKRKR